MEGQSGRKGLCLRTDKFPRPQIETGLTVKQFTFLGKRTGISCVQRRGTLSRSTLDIF
ncbi:hypothetical protein I79_004960 [Cricetulus griseus]|uniref:Uncharacterized protein n=1 Tax=Cricetulus griseus TaxID=10029 RepID=G3H3W9_CRIGR|nr:hypothetical protein I79_004960 [Cricetulus griseus]